jgi:hypothetical protein
MADFAGAPGSMGGISVNLLGRPAAQGWAWS